MGADSPSVGSPAGDQGGLDAGDPRPGGVPSPRRGRLGRVAILTLGVVLALIGGWLGLWQMQVFEDQQANSASARAALPPLELREVSGVRVPQSYGRRVIARGAYLAEQQLRVLGDAPARDRVVTALRLEDGRVLPVVRGEVDAATLPPAPVGPVVQTGILLPSEVAASGTGTPGTSRAVSVAELVQSWPGPLVEGYLALGEPDAQAQGLTAAPAELPAGTGSVRNAGYAVQWWVFGAFALIMSVVIARSGGRRLPGGPQAG